MNKTSNHGKIYKNVPEDWEDRYGWYYYADTIRYYGSTQHNYISVAETTVKHCPKCNKQWQYDCNAIQYYECLPTYKMTRVVCRRCKAKYDKN